MQGQQSPWTIEQERFEAARRRLHAAPPELNDAAEHHPAVHALREQYLRGDIGYLEMLEQSVVALNRGYWNMVEQAQKAAQRTEGPSIDPNRI